MKAVVRANLNKAGTWGAVARSGRLAVGQAIILHPSTMQEFRKQP